MADCLKIAPILAYVATLRCETLMSENKRPATNYKAVYLRCGGLVNNLTKKGLLLSSQVKKIKILATRLLKDDESVRDSHVLSCNFNTKYSPI